MASSSMYLVFLTTGFAVGFGHCIGMCGPIVVSLSMNLREKHLLIPHLLYNSGRVMTYALLGGVMGWTGAFTQVAASIAHLQKAVMIFAGFVIIILGLAMIGWVPFGHVFSDGDGPTRWMNKGFQRLTTSRSASAYFPLGLLLGLLPCGPVYTALVGAARFGMDAPSTGDGFVRGVGLMLAFGIGTVPALLIVAKAASLGWIRWRERIYRLSGVFMVIVGVYFVVKGIRY